MSILINSESCIGCGKCRQVCPGNLLKSTEDNKTFIKYPLECWGCTSCIKECPVQAIKYFLGADIGGRGSLLSVKNEKDIMHWMIETKEGNVQTISINKKKSNTY